jgi:hypothetical protein
MKKNKSQITSYFLTWWKNKKGNQRKQNGLTLGIGAQTLFSHKRAEAIIRRTETTHTHTRESNDKFTFSYEINNMWAAAAAASGCRPPFHLGNLQTRLGKIQCISKSPWYTSSIVSSHLVRISYEKKKRDSFFHLIRESVTSFHFLIVVIAQLIGAHQRWSTIKNSLSTSQDSSSATPDSLGVIEARRCVSFFSSFLWRT